MYNLHVLSYALLASQSSINIWSLLNGYKLQTIPVPMSGHHQQSPVICFTNNFSGVGQYSPALITAIEMSLKAFSLKYFYSNK